MTRSPIDAAIPRVSGGISTSPPYSKAVIVDQLLVIGGGTVIVAVGSVHAGPRALRRRRWFYDNTGLAPRRYYPALDRTVGVLLSAIGGVIVASGLLSNVSDNWSQLGGWLGLGAGALLAALTWSATVICPPAEPLSLRPRPRGRNGFGLVLP